MIEVILAGKIRLFCKRLYIAFVAYKDLYRSVKPLENMLAQTKTSVSGWTHFVYQ